MGYEITKFNFQDDLASASFNAKFQEIQTYLNNIEEELKNVKEENTKLKEQLNNKVEKIIHLPNNTDFNTLNQVGQYAITAGGVNAPVSYDESTPTHWNINVYWGNPNDDVFYQVAQSVREPNKLFKRYSINGTFYSWSVFSDDFDKTRYKQLQNVQGTDVDILEFAKNLKASGFFQLFYQNKNVPTTGNWDWAFANIFYYNETTISLEIRAIFPPHSVAKVAMVNGNWSAWSVV